MFSILPTNPNRGDGPSSTVCWLLLLRTPALYIRTFGVYAYVYTIDPTVPNYEAHFQWDTIVLDYDRGYWLQLGYHSNPPYHGRIFYYEVFDSNGSIHQDLQIAPDTGETYKYIIVYTPLPNWKFIIRQGTTDIYSKEVSVDPYYSKDLQAFVETTTSSINIDGTHFSNLMYYTGQAWPYWDRHYPWVDSPYYLEEISHYEFRAGGGG